MSKTQRLEQSGQHQQQRIRDHQRTSSLMTNYQRLAPLGQQRGCTTESRMGQLGPEQQHHQQQQQQQQQQQHPCFFLPNEAMTSMTTTNLPPVPQTPFDPSYGASLLPSHMLMGSPFLSTPIRPQGPFHSSAPGHNNHSMHHSSSTRSSYIYYPQPPILKPIPPRKKKSVALKHNEPYEINFKILPKGRDEYMTRSLLFTNLEMEPNIDIHKFLTDFIKYGPIESLFLLDDNHSILLSFLTKNVCLDFYNNLLQKFSEFKSRLHSPKLSVSFVCQDEASWFKSLQINVVTRGATRSIYVEFEDQSLELHAEFVRETFPWLFCSQRYVVERVDVVKNAKPNQNFAKNYVLVHYICISMALEVDDYLQHPTQKKLFGISKVQFINANGHSSDVFDDDTVVTTNSYQQDSRTSSVSSLSLPMSNLSEHAELFHSLNTTLDTISLQVIPSEYPTPEIVLHDEHLNSVTISKPSKSLASSSSLVEMDASVPNAASQHGSNGVPGVLMLNDPSSSTNTPAILSSELNVSTPIIAGSMSNQMLGGAPPLSMQNVNDANVSSPAFFVDPMSTAPITETLQRQYLMGASQLNGLNNRTVYIGNIHPRSKPEDICNVVRGGILQNIKWIQSKRICFVTFIEMAAAVQFYANATLEPIVLHGNVLRVGWGQPSGELPKNIALAVTVGASRNVYVSLPEYSFKEKYINNPEFKLYHGKYSLPGEEQLRQDFTKYGQIEQINYLEDGHCCWVNFMNIAYAIRLVEDSNSSSERNLAKFHAQFNGRYRNLIIGYGKDRCGNVNRNLAANKNSKFFKKAKKQSHNKLIKPRSLGEVSSASSADDEVETDAASTTKKAQISKEVNLDELLNGKPGQELSEGLGISLAAVHVSDKNQANKKINSEAVSNGNGSKANKAKKELSDTSIGDNLTTTPANKLEEEEDVGYSTSGSSDIDIIVAPPADNNKTNSAASVNGKFKNKTRSNYKKPQKGAALNLQHSQLYSLSSYVPVMSNGALDADSPLTSLNSNRESSEINPRSGSGQSPVDPPVAPFNSNYSYNGHNSLGSNSTKSRRKRRAKYSKPIAGQDVMNQYLEHLHHSTLQYATNILGATTVHEPLGGYCDLSSNEH